MKSTTVRHARVRAACVSIVGQLSIYRDLIQQSTAVRATGFTYFLPDAVKFYGPGQNQIGTYC